MKRLLAMLLLVGMLFAVLPAHAAETVIQDGIKVTLITDKDSYEADEWINAQLDIQNTSNYPIKNVRTSIVAPEGYMLLNGSYAEYAELSAGQSYIYKNSMTAAPEEPVVIPQTGDDSHIGLWVLLASASFVAFCVLSVKNRKAGRMMSMLLCVVLVSTLLPSSVPAKADVVTKSIVVTKTVAIGGQAAIVKGIVTYDYEVEPATFKAGDFVCTYDETGKGVMILEYVGTAKDIIVFTTINGRPVTGIATDAFDGHEGITLRVGAGSVAENYAQNMGIPYVVIGATPAPAATATPTVNPTATPTATPTAMVTATPTITPKPPETSLDYFVYSIENGECTIVEFKCSSENCPEVVVVPEKIEGYPVTTIASFAFQGTTMSKVVLPDTVKVIENEAFSLCFWLEKIELSNSLTRIEHNAFHSCRKLADVILPDSLTYIGSGAFCGCAMLETIIIPKNVKEIGEDVFAGCKNMQCIYVDDQNNLFYTSNFSLVSIDGKLIYCAGAALGDEYVVHSGITSIGYNAFCDTNITSVIIPKSVTTIESKAFSFCEQLNKIFIPPSVTSISSTSFTRIDPDAVIYGIKGSYAETYAEQEGITFCAIDESEFPGYVSNPTDQYISVDDLIVFEEAPQSDASLAIKKLYTFGEQAGASNSAISVLLEQILNDKTTANVLAEICIKKYTAGAGWIDAGLESIMMTLTNPSETSVEGCKDFGAALFQETMLDIMGAGNLPDVSAASNVDLISSANDVATITMGLDEFIFFNDVQLSGWNTYFDSFAETLGYTEVDVFGNITVTNQRAYDELGNLFRMRKASDIQTLEDHINEMLKVWQKNGKCIIDNGVPRFAREANGAICKEGETYAEVMKMRNTASKVQSNIKKFGNAAKVIGYVADIVSLYSSYTKETNELKAVSDSYTRNKLLLSAICAHSAGDSKDVAQELLTGLNSDFDTAVSNPAWDNLLDRTKAKAVEAVLSELLDVCAEGSILGAILAGGKIAGMIPMVQQAKEAIDCQHMIVGWYGVQLELEGALEKAMSTGSPYSLYLADLYIEWQIKGLEVTQKYYQLLRDYVFSNDKEIAGAEQLLKGIADELVTWYELQSNMWAQYYK